MLYFCSHNIGRIAANILDMNTQEIITPVAKFIEWTFETVLVPLSNPFNLGVILLVVGGIAFWLRKQRQYTAQARQSGDII